MGCQKDIAKEIVSFEAEFEGYEIDLAETFDKGHGRLESRRC